MIYQKHTLHCFKLYNFKLSIFNTSIFKHKTYYQIAPESFNQVFEKSSQKNPTKFPKFDYTLIIEFPRLKQP